MSVSSTNKNKGFKLPRWEELPDIDLYLDQVMSLLEQWLGGVLPGRNKAVLTRTMINNYVKQKIIPAPVNKKYEKRTVAALFLVVYLKEIYSISDIARLIAIVIDKDDMAPAYNKFCRCTEDAVEKVFSSKQNDEIDYLMKQVATSFASQHFVLKKYLNK